MRATVERKNWIAQLRREGDFSTPRYVLNSKTLPFISFTGVTTVEQVKKGVVLFNSEISQCTDHAPMIGILVSPLTFESGNACNSKYPKLDDISAIVNASEGNALMAINYDNRSGEQEATYRNVNHLMSKKEVYSKGLCYALKFDAPYSALPKPAIVQKLKDTWRLKMILPLQDLPSDETSMRDSIQRMLDKYGKVADYFMIDSSNGERGERVFKSKSIAAYLELRNMGFSSMISFSGGLNHRTSYHFIKVLRKELGTDDFSLDSDCKEGIGMYHVQEYLSAVSDGFAPNTNLRS